MNERQGLAPNVRTFFQPPEGEIGAARFKNLYTPLPPELYAPKSKVCACDEEPTVQKVVLVGGDPDAATFAPTADGQLRRQMGILQKQPLPEGESCDSQNEERNVTPAYDTPPKAVIVSMPEKSSCPVHKEAHKQYNADFNDKDKTCNCSTKKGIAPLRAVLLENEDVITRRPLCQFKEKKEPGFCRLREKKTPIGIQPGFDVTANLKRPVGILLNPELVGDSTSGENDEVKFYPCKVKEKNFNANAYGVTPICPKETSYQMDFVYRGKDLGKCQTYQFHTEKKICEFVTIDDQITPSVYYGRQRTDLKPRMKKQPGDELYMSPYGQGGRSGFSTCPAQKLDSNGKRITEYMAGISKLGGEIFACNLYEYARRKARRIKA